jgi:hypothetical protein
LLAYRMFVEKIAKESGANVNDVLKRQKLIFHINDEVEAAVFTDLKAMNYYGFDVSNMYFINQPEFAGYRLEKKGQALSLKLDEKSPKLVYGHGDNAVQLNVAGDAYQITAAGEKKYLENGLLSYLGQRNVMSHRINDLTKFLVDEVVGLEKLALGMYLHDQGHNIVADLVDNPNKQKGGTATNYGLLEKLSADGSKGLMGLIDELGEEGAPYNAFRLLYRADTLNELIKNNELPYYLRFNDGYFYLEAVTGDLTQYEDSKTAFIQKEGDLIHDFKTTDNLMEAIEFLKKQDEELKAFGATLKGLVSSPVTSNEEIGGIDLNAIDVNRQGEASVSIQFDPVAVQEILDMGITGFAPVIINITPLPSVLPLLGLAPQREEDYELTKS